MNNDYKNNSSEIESYKDINTLRREADDRFFRFALWCIGYITAFCIIVVSIFVWAFFTYL